MHMGADNTFIDGIFKVIVNLISTIMNAIISALFVNKYIAIVIYFALLLILGRLCTAKNQYKVVTTLPIVALLFCVLV